MANITDKELRLYVRSCRINDIPAVRELLSLGADVNCRYGYAGLHWAAFENYGELLDLLLTQAGVDVNITDNDYWTPLMYACLRGHDNIVRRLSQVPAIQYNCRDVNGTTALHQAVLSKNPQCVEVLRGAGASVDWNVRNNNGNYPLTLAVFYGYTDILQTILSVPQLDFSVTDIFGRNVAQIAVVEYKGDRQRVVEILSQDSRVDWNIKDYDGDTPLMYCMKNNKMEMARCLINTPGVDLDTVDRDGKYLEDFAREYNQVEVLEILETFTTNRLRMIQQDSLLYRQSNTPPSLLDISRDAVLVTLITSNTEERKVKPLVDNLEGIIPRTVREMMEKNSYSQ